MNGLTVRLALDRLALRPGQTLGVTGAAGAVTPMAWNGQMVGGGEGRDATTQPTTSAVRALASEPRAQTRIERIAQAVAEDVDSEHGEGQEDPREQDVRRGHRT